MNPSGWPELVIYLVEKLSDGSEIVKAYGSGHIPTEAGSHKKSIRMYSPLKTNSFWEYFGFSVPSEDLDEMSLDPKAMANAEGREYSRVMASGKILVTMNITQRNMTRHGFITSNRN